MKTMNIIEQVNYLTIAEYCLLRRVCFLGSIKDNDEDTSPATLSNLLEKKLIAHSQVIKSEVHPTDLGREILLQTRIKLGINRL